MKPRFKHDCDTCNFLGHYTDDDGYDFDLYHCIQGGLIGIPTVIARYGDKGYEYMSGIGMTNTNPLQEAEKRAKEKNLPVIYRHST